MINLELTSGERSGEMAASFTSRKFDLDFSSTSSFGAVEDAFTLTDETASFFVSMAFLNGLISSPQFVAKTSRNRFLDVKEARDSLLELPSTDYVIKEDGSCAWSQSKSVPKGY